MSKHNCDYLAHIIIEMYYPSESYCYERIHDKQLIAEIEVDDFQNFRITDKNKPILVVNSTYLREYYYKGEPVMAIIFFQESDALYKYHYVINRII